MGAAKSAPEIRDISQTTRIHASMILAVVFYRYDASHHWLPVAAISGAGKYSMFGLRSLACLYLLLPSAGREERTEQRSSQQLTRNCEAIHKPHSGCGSVETRQPSQAQSLNKQKGDCINTIPINLTGGNISESVSKLVRPQPFWVPFRASKRYASVRIPPCQISVFISELNFMFMNAASSPTVRPAA